MNPSITWVSKVQENANPASFFGKTPAGGRNYKGHASLTGHAKNWDPLVPTGLHSAHI